MSEPKQVIIATKNSNNLLPKKKKKNLSLCLDNRKQNVIKNKRIDQYLQEHSTRSTTFLY